MRRVSFLVLPVAAAALLAGCGSDDSGGGAPATSAPPSTATSSVASSAPASKSSVATSAPASTSSASSVGVAPAGSAIKAGSASRFPATVDGFEKQNGSGQITIYSKDGNLASLSFLSGSEYESIATNVTQQRTPAGTGICGSTSQPTNLTCYLRTADGVINVSADSGDVPLAELVTFVNQLTAALGTG